MANPLRTRSATAKVTEEEYQQLETAAKVRELTLSDWCRRALLVALDVDQGSVASRSAAVSSETLLLAEILSIRMLLLNLIYPLGRGEILTAEKIQSVIDQADSKKLRAALEYLRQARVTGT